MSPSSPSMSSAPPLVPVSTTSSSSSAVRLSRSLAKTGFVETETEARRMAWELARGEGIFAGTSTGLNVTGAIQLAREIGAGHTVVTVAVDSGLKYLAGDLYAART